MTSSAPRAYFAGVDGGGSHTRVVIASRETADFFFGDAAGCNPQQLGPALAQARIAEAFATAWASANLAPQPLQSVFLGLAGLSAFSAQRPVQEFLGPLFPVRPRSIAWDHDLRIALAGGLSGREGIVLVAGTGSACYGRASDGRSARVGGWGPLLDDVGGGYWLGLELLRHMVRVYDGREAKSEMTELFERETHLDTSGSIVSWTAQLGEPRPAIAKLGKVVLQSWDQGDPQAARLVQTGSQSLAQMAAATATKLFPRHSTEVVFAGGLSLHSGYAETVARELTRRGQLEFRRSEQTALVGALLLSFAEAGETPSEQFLKKLRNLPSR